MTDRWMVPRRVLLSAGAVMATGCRPASAQPAPSRDVKPLDALPAPGTRPPDGLQAARTGHGRPARWEVVADASAEAGRAVTQTEADPTDFRYPLLIWRDLAVADVEASVLFKTISGRVDRAGGLAVRVADADNYVVVRANALEDNVRLYPVVRGDRQQFAGANVRVPSGEWHSLMLRAEDDRFTVTFNGKLLFTAIDRTLLGPGNVALWTKADSVTRFTTLVIKPLF